MEYAHASFQSTNWSVVLSAAASPDALEELLRAYWGPIYAYIRGSGVARDDAGELTQEFIAHTVLGRGVLEAVDPERGRFRTFLKAVIRNFLIDQHRRATTQRRASDRPVLGGAALDQFEPVEDGDPSRAFERQWAATVLSQALTRLEAECNSCGQERHWKAFQMVVVEPILSRGVSVPPPLERVAEAVGAQSAAQASSLVQTVRRKFQRVLYGVVSATVDNPADASDELARLREALSR